MGLSGFVRNEGTLMRLEVAARTDVGIVRSGNEDNFYADVNTSRGLFIVADGMGGHAAGEVASEMAVQIVSGELNDVGGLPWSEVRAAMDRALRKANLLVHERTIVERDKQGMGTTVSALLLRDGRYVIGQIGDSRIYLLRDGVLTQLTTDHSYVQEQVDAGFLTPEQARYHPYSSVITRCVGAGERVEPDIFEGDARVGDLFLVASDGLTGMIDDNRLHQMLLNRLTPERLVNALIAEANSRGGLDNITAVVAHIQPDEVSSATLTPPGMPPLPE